MLTIFLLVPCVSLASEQVTVSRLEAIVSSVQQSPDNKAAKRLDGLELTERLSNTRLERLHAELPGDESRQKLLVMADAAAFLNLPAADILVHAAPDHATQGAMLSRAVDYVAATTAKMPDFLATRTTTRYRNFRPGVSEDIPLIETPHSFHLFDHGNMLVRYSNGNEEEDRLPTKSRKDGISQSTGATSLGLFGPLLDGAMSDILKGKIGWGHWEQGSGGPVAVFRYAVAGDKSRYAVHFCCLPAGPGKGREYDATPPYHGEISIDPDTGDVLRIALETDPVASAPISRADVLIEYGAVEMGAKRYMCPLKSVSVTSAEMQVGHGGTYWNETDSYSQVKETHKVTWINDIVFADYHVFATQMRIVPEEN